MQIAKVSRSFCAVNIYVQVQRQYFYFFEAKKSYLSFYCIAQPNPDARKATAFDFVGVIIGIALAVSLIVAVVVAYR